MRIWMDMQPCLAAILLPVPSGQLSADNDNDDVDFEAYHHDAWIIS